MTNRKTEVGLFEVLEERLRKAKEPLDCATLFSFSDVRQHAATVNRVSDYLGNLWRKGLVLRLPAPRLEGTKARWLYVWKDKGPRKVKMPTMDQAIAYDPAVDRMLGKPNVHVSDDGRTVTITTPYSTIIIAAREGDED